jgi:hypothetical protein
MQQAIAASVATNAAESAGSTLSFLAKSKLGLSGLALTLSGFFGIFGVATLQLQQGILSAYVMLFGVLLILFSLGAHTEMLAKYFGFVYRPNGQLVFLLIAGNLAWSSGFLGILAAVLTNSVAITAWYAASAESGTLPWGPRGGADQTVVSASGMVDVDRDELL